MSEGGLRMRRILLVLLVAAMMLALTAGAAFATGAPGGPDTANCQGSGMSNFVSGPNDGTPGSPNDPFPGTTSWNGPFTSDLAHTDPGNGVSQPVQLQKAFFCQP